MKLHDHFANGTVENICGKPDKIIETIISKVYFFDNDVYKVYKHEPNFIGPFNNPRFRHDFYHADYTWNRTMAGEVYKKLVGYNVEGTFSRVSQNKPHDYAIHMKRYSEQSLLLYRLREKSVINRDADSIARSMLNKLSILTNKVRSSHEAVFSRPFTQVLTDHLATFNSWLSLPINFLSNHEINQCLIPFRDAIYLHPYFKKVDSSEYMAAIDNHAGNILLSESVISFIDSMPPMPKWRVHHPVFIIARPAIDCAVLQDELLGDVMFSVLEDFTGTVIEPVWKYYMQALAAFIQGAYMHMLGDMDLVDPYLSYARDKTVRLISEVNQYK